MLANVKGKKEASLRLAGVYTSIDKDIQEHLVRLGDEITQSAKLNLQNNDNVVTGELLASIGIQSEKEHLIEWGTMLERAWWIEYGRGEVRPITAKALHFITKDGHEVFTKLAKAFPPSPFAEPAVIAKSAPFADLLVQFLTDKVEK